MSNLKPVAGWAIAEETGAVEPNPPVVFVEKLNADVVAGFATPNPPNEGVPATAWTCVFPNPDWSPRLGWLAAGVPKPKLVFGFCAGGLALKDFIKKN